MTATATTWGAYGDTLDCEVCGPGADQIEVAAHWPGVYVGYWSWCSGSSSREFFETPDEAIAYLRSRATFWLEEGMTQTSTSFSHLADLLEAAHIERTTKGN